MSEDDEPIEGIDAVPPHRRDVVARRVAVIRAYLADRRRGNLAAAARSLGLSTESFRLLVRAWELTGSPMALAGSGGLRQMPDALTSEQAEIIALATAELPDAILERVAERALTIAAERGVRMVGQAALIKHIAIAAVGRLPAASPAAGADLVVEHCVIDVGVAISPRGRGVMPFATVVTRVADPIVLAVEMSREQPTAAATRSALKNALGHLLGVSDGDRSLVVFAQLLSGADWDDLASDIQAAGVELIEERSDAPSPPKATIRLIGRNPGRIAIKARLGRRVASARIADLPRGARPMTMEEATSFVRARWMTDKPPHDIDVPEERLRDVRSALGRPPPI